MLLCEVVPYYSYLSFSQEEALFSLFPQHRIEDLYLGVHSLLLCFQRGKYLFHSAPFFYDAPRGF